MRLETQAKEWTAAEIRDLIRERLMPHFDELAQCGSTAELLAHHLYPELSGTIDRVLQSPEVEHFSHLEAPAKPSYRFLAWNLERGIQLDGQLHEFRTHEYLKTCDVLLLTETDVGMARSGNRDVARTLAEELGFHYAFAPCYLNLAKGAGTELDVDGENDLGLHGNAILSRYPMRNVRSISLENGKDKMSGREKRLGNQSAVAAEIVFPNTTVHTASIHLDAHSTQRHRKEQLETVIAGLPAGAPALIGGDWNTTTFNSSTAFHSIMGYWLRVLMGPGNVIDNHYLHPYNRFEKELFQMLARRGFDYENANSIGEYTIYYEFEDNRTYQGLSEWVPQWCFPFIRWALRNHDGKCPLKLDWFAGRDVRLASPVVIHDLREDRDPPLSDHDAIGVDLLVPPRPA